MNFLFKKVHAGRDLFALLGELNQGPGDRPPKLKKGAGTFTLVTRKEHAAKQQSWLVDAWMWMWM